MLETTALMTMGGDDVDDDDDVNNEQNAAAAADGGDKKTATTTSDTHYHNAMHVFLNTGPLYSHLSTLRRWPCQYQQQQQRQQTGLLTYCDCSLSESLEPTYS